MLQTAGRMLQTASRMLLTADRLLLTADRMLCTADKNPDRPPDCSVRPAKNDFRPTKDVDRTALSAAETPKLNPSNVEQEGGRVRGCVAPRKTGSGGFLGDESPTAAVLPPTRPGVCSTGAPGRPTHRGLEPVLGGTPKSVVDAALPWI